MGISASLSLFNVDIYTSDDGPADVHFETYYQSKTCPKYLNLPFRHSMKSPKRLQTKKTATLSCCNLSLLCLYCNQQRQILGFLIQRNQFQSSFPANTVHREPPLDTLQNLAMVLSQAQSDSINIRLISGLSTPQLRSEK